MAITAECRAILNAGVTPGPAAKSAVSEAERILAVRFPHAYREFLFRYGAAMLNGFDIAGVIDKELNDPPMWVNIVEATQQTRRVSRDNLPITYVPISDDGADITYYLDTEEQESFFVFACGPGVEKQLFSDNFSGFVLQLVSRTQII